MTHALHVLRSILGWVTLGIVGALGLLVMLVTPGAQWRRRIGRWTCKTVLAVAGIRLRSDRPLEDALPKSCVIVANHTSYLDGLILTAALPPRFAFVIKKEMSRVPVAGLLLRLLGSEFVDRFDRHRGAMDARRVLRRASAGQALVFFPEGTFSKQPGLLRFHSGAFVTAARAGCPVVPIVIHGARRVLPHDRALCTPGTIRLEVLDAVQSDPANPQTATQLRDEVRRRMLARLGEPDLALLPSTEPAAEPAPVQTHYNAGPPGQQDFQ